MSIMYNKGQNFELLKTTFKVPQSGIDNLKALGASLKVGTASIALATPSITKECSLNTLVSNAVKSPQPSQIVQVNAFVAEFVKVAQAAATVGKPTATPTANVAAKVISSTNNFAVANAMPIVKLRDATALYQRVRGTSGGSIYRVVAMNSLINVAVRINSGNVSVRVEGDFNPDITKAFIALGLSKKTDEHMSNHFVCENCTPQKLIGAILMGSGIAFDTPIPVITEASFA